MENSGLGGKKERRNVDKIFAETEATAKNGKMVQVGDVWAMNDFGAFADVVILGLSKDGEALVSRPYLYASSVGTTCPTPLLGCETYSLPVEHIVQHFKLRDTGRTL